MIVGSSGTKDVPGMQCNTLNTKYCSSLHRIDEEVTRTSIPNDSKLFSVVFVNLLFIWSLYVEFLIWQPCWHCGLCLR